MALGLSGIEPFSTLSFVINLSRTSLDIWIIVEFKSSLAHLSEHEGNSNTFILDEIRFWRFLHTLCTSLQTFHFNNSKSFLSIGDLRPENLRQELTFHIVRLHSPLRLFKFYGLVCIRRVKLSLDNPIWPATCPLSSKITFSHNQTNKIK